MSFRDSLENSADADTSQSTESHTAEIFLASVGLQPRYLTCNILCHGVNFCQRLKSVVYRLNLLAG